MKPFILALLLPVLGYGQDTLQTSSPPAVNYLEENVWRVLFLNPGVAYEHQWGKTLTLVADLRLDGALKAANQGSLQSSNKPSYYISPYLTAGVRHFYNLERRLLKGKSLRYNSGNYLMLRVEELLPPFIRHEEPNVPISVQQGPALSVLWGFQRTYRRNFYLNLALGLKTSNYYTGTTIDFMLGYTFPSKHP